MERGTTSSICLLKQKLRNPLVLALLEIPMSRPFTWMRTIWLVKRYPPWSIHLQWRPVSFFSRKFPLVNKTSVKLHVGLSNPLLHRYVPAVHLWTTRKYIYWPRTYAVAWFFADAVPKEFSDGHWDCPNLATVSCTNLERWTGILTTCHAAQLRRQLTKKTVHLPVSRMEGSDMRSEKIAKEFREAVMSVLKMPRQYAPDRLVRLVCDVYLDNGVW